MTLGIANGQMDAPETGHGEIDGALIAAVGLWGEWSVVWRSVVAHIRHTWVDIHGERLFCQGIGCGDGGALLRDISTYNVATRLPVRGVRQREEVCVVAYLERLEPCLSVG